jgi:hypothetical protein
MRLVLFSKPGLVGIWDDEPELNELGNKMDRLTLKVRI